MAAHRVVTQDEWRAQRVELLAREKELTKLRDEIARRRRDLPWVRVDTEYVFDATNGRTTLAGLFGGRSQLLVYHFMFGPDWDEGCKSCSFWADTFDRLDVHLAHRDVTFVAASRGPLDKLQRYRERMGWSFEWVSSAPSSFNLDFGVSYTPEQQKSGAEHNYRRVDEPGDELPGISAFALDGGDVYHTYSAYSRGLDAMNGAYQLLDLVSKGRDEDALSWPMEWLRRRDEYDD